MNLSYEEKIKAQGRARAKKYYDLHKAELLDKKREQRKKCKLAMESFNKDQPPANFEFPDNMSILDRLDKLNIKDATKKKYKNDLKTIMRISDCDDLQKCLKSYKTIISKLKDGTQVNTDKEYSINTRKGLIQAILYSIDHLRVKVSDTAKKAYKNYFEEMKILSTSEHEEKQFEEPIISFKDYLAKTKTTFGVDSKENILANMYFEIPARDNFYLKIVNVIPKTLEGNYLFVPKTRTGRLKVILSNYKTITKYGVQNVMLSLELSNLIRKYMTKNNLKENEYLFGNTEKNASFINAMNKKMDINGSAINLFRQMKVSSMLSTKNFNDPQERIKLANSMMHSPAVQLKYLREIIENN